MLKRFMRTIAAPLALGLLLAGCGEMHDHEAEAAAADAARVGPAPDFTLTDMQGNDVSLSDYKGQVVLLNFWATWCGPCKIEMPWFVEFQQQYKDKGFTVLAVSLDDDIDPVAPFAVANAQDPRPGSQPVGLLDEENVRGGAVTVVLHVVQLVPKLAYHLGGNSRERYALESSYGRDRAGASEKSGGGRTSWKRAVSRTADDPWPAHPGHRLP